MQQRDRDPVEPADDRPPAGDEQPLVHLVGRLLRWFDQGVVNLLAERGHSPKRSHALVMSNLDPGGTSETELARRSGVSRQAIHLVVKDLTALGYVVLRDHPHDRRSRVVEHTDLGRTVAVDAQVVLRELEEALADRISPESVDALRAALARDPGPALHARRAGS